MTDALPPAIPAATLVIFRETGDGPPELLMVERARAMVFAGGALVFPGGRIDPGDHAMAALAHSADPDDTAARIAAIRETIEEVGLPIGLAPSPGPGDLPAIRSALHAGTAFAQVLDAAGVRLDPTVLTLFARWRPTHAPARVFDTRFYLARLPDHSPVATVDRTENVHLSWRTARAVLDDADAGNVTLLYPTRRNLERLAQFACFDEAVADARRYPVRTITPFLAQVDGVARWCIPDDAGYPIFDEPVSDAVRG